MSLAVPHFEPYVKLFEYHYGATNVSIEFSNNLDDETHGECNVYDDGSREILINEIEWWSLTELEQEQLILHELGHCLLERDHNDKLDRYGHPISIMNSDAFIPDYVYNQKRSFYMKELFYAY